jgi:hypothetical protein
LQLRERMAVNSLLVEETDEWAEKEVERELACMTEEDLVRDDEELFPENHPDKTGANVSVFASLYEKVVERRSEFLHETSRFIDGTKQETRQALFGMNPAETVDVAEQVGLLCVSVWECVVYVHGYAPSMMCGCGPFMLHVSVVPYGVWV